MADIKLAFDRRFGRLFISADGPVQGNIALSDIMRDFQVRPEELGGYQEVAKLPAETRGMEEIYREAIAGLDLKGKTVLDIGGFDGRTSRYALDLGAARAICLDNRQWEHYGWKETDKLPGVEYVTGDFMEWREQADVVLFLNVLYHCQNPWAALEHLRGITKEAMVLCTLVKFDTEPRWYLYETREANPEDDTVYWGPSKPGVLRLLKLTGWTPEVAGQAIERLVVTCL